MYDLSQHFYPLQYNEHRGEPFLRLPPPFSDIILTPPRLSDASSIVPLLNDERVIRWLEGPPWPYKEEHANDWLNRNGKAAQTIIQEIKSKPSTEFISGCPVRIIREVRDGEEIFLGDCGIDTWGYEDVADLEARVRLREENETRSPEEKDWCFGDYLAPSHHGKGIMTCVVKTLLANWIIPRMGAREIYVTAFKGNQGSVRVFEKNGFILKKTLDDWKSIAEDKGGGKTGIHVLQWRNY